jgi:hypothetical protein
MLSRWIETKADEYEAKSRRPLMHSNGIMLYALSAPYKEFMGAFNSLLNRNVIANKNN